jgi:hypothetical protein
MIGFTMILHLVTTSNNNSVFNLRTLKITIAQAESQPVIAFTSRSSVTVPNNRDFSALILTSLRAGYSLTTVSTVESQLTRVKSKSKSKSRAIWGGLPAWLDGLLFLTLDWAVRIFSLSVSILIYLKGSFTSASDMDIFLIPSSASSEGFQFRLLCSRNPEFRIGWRCSNGGLGYILFGSALFEDCRQVL